ncbi:MAG TPA: DUF642 domain-containing protein [Polyangiaceae bacterium]|nr:DUF642 domain-containing protein [Polyangiaceae bacterium]
MAGTEVGVQAGSGAGGAAETATSGAAGDENTGGNGLSGAGGMASGFGGATSTGAGGEEVNAGSGGESVGGCEQRSLLVNCSFESPVVPAGGYELFATGSSFEGWTVVGETGNVAPLSGGYVSDGITWPPEDGNQTLDLTGLSNTATGVSQSVATAPDASYTLSFWSGNVVAAPYGTTSVVHVLVDDSEIATTTNSDGTGTNTLAWKRFVLHFSATSALTTIEFLNGDASDDDSNIIDDVTLTKDE